MTSVLYMLKIWSKPAFIRLPRFSIAISTMMGIMPGMVTCQVWRMRPAPSITAASYSVGSMAVIAAR